MGNINSELIELTAIKKNIHELRKQFDEVIDENIRGLLKRIISTSDKVYKELLVNSDKVSKAARFGDFYLPTIKGIVAKYVTLTKNGINNADAREALAKTEEVLSKSADSFDVLYQSLFTNEAIDLDVEMAVLTKEMGI